MGRVVKAEVRTRRDPKTGDWGRIPIGVLLAGAGEPDNQLQLRNLSHAVEQAVLGVRVEVDETWRAAGRGIGLRRHTGLVCGRCWEPSSRIPTQAGPVRRRRRPAEQHGA